MERVFQKAVDVPIESLPRLLGYVDGNNDFMLRVEKVDVAIAFRPTDMQSKEFALQRRVWNLV